MNQLMNRLWNPDLGLLFVRLALGAVFIYAGWFKINNIEMITGFFGTLGFSAFWAYVVAYAEFLGGIAFVLGVAVRYFGIITSVIMLTAMFKVHWAKGFSLSNGGYEQVLVLLLLSLCLVVSGAGKYSVSKFLNKNW
jgi:putative oxidoreductase